MFIQRIAHQLGAIWRPTPTHDYGLDGELELTGNGEVTGLIFKVQIKSGSSYLRNRTSAGFSFYIDPADCSYWPKVTNPVILVVYDPEADAGYWIDVKRHLQCPDELSPSTVRFSYTKNRFTKDSLLDLSVIAIPDEGERTEFLVGKIRERLHSNILPVVGLPDAVYEAEFSPKRLAEAEEYGTFFIKSHGGKYRGFRDPRDPRFRLTAYIDAPTVKELRYPEYLKRSGSRNFAIWRWNVAIREFMTQRGLIPKDESTFYFAPDAGNTPRRLTWESTRVVRLIAKLHTPISGSSRELWSSG
jgi:hypothetical protein